MPEDAFIGETAGLIWLGGAITAWYTGRAAANVATAYNQSHQTASQQQSSAQQGAQQELAGASTTRNCPNCNGPKCDDLYEKIRDLTRDLAQQRGAMLADPLKMYDLHLQNPTAKVPDPRNPGKDLGNWDGHRQQINQRKKELNGRIEQYKKEGCGGGLPTGAETQAGLDTPTTPGPQFK